MSAGREAVVAVGGHRSAHDDESVEAFEGLGQRFGDIGAPLVNLDPDSGQGLADRVGGLGLEVLDNQATRHVMALSLRGQRRADRSRTGGPL